MTVQDLRGMLDAVTVDDAVFALRPDYRVMLLAVAGIEPGESEDASEALLQEAEAHAREALAAMAVTQIPHVAAWRDAYKAFGTKPQRFRNSLEALMRCAEGGLPRINRLTDIYNAISVMHQVPLGGEDLDRYDGPPRLVRAAGDEPFDTTANGEDVIEHPESSEVVWRDNAGVTCRRWNWRQARRTALTDETTTALFILDALAPMSDEALVDAAAPLAGHLSHLGLRIRIERRLIGAGHRA
jgi:DNA/RNA-binding domain of Phe-tRNA-synthetase-like protein